MVAANLLEKQRLCHKQKTISHVSVMAFGKSISNIALTAMKTALKLPFVVAIHKTKTLTKLGQIALLMC